MDKIMGTRAVAALLGVKAPALSQAIWDGRIPRPTMGVGHTYWWNEEDVRRAARVFGKKLPVENVVATDGQGVGE